MSTNTPGGTAVVAAVDLGATSGRVILGSVGENELGLRHVARFANDPVAVTEQRRSALHWDVLGLYRAVLTGLADAVRSEPEVASIGVDSWAVDYGLVRDGALLGVPYHYRDERNAAAVTDVHALIAPEDLFARTGLQHLPFNTVFQLQAEASAGRLGLADTALLIPDLIGYWLTGHAATEVTNASTTGLLDPRTRTWDTDLFARLRIPTGLFPRLIQPGEHLGPLLPTVAARLGAPSHLGVAAVGSHDTASAVVAVPATDESSTTAYISSGTWSLVGVELPAPVLSEAAFAANFTNEGGVDDRVRFLTNVSGLWLLSESMRSWEAGGSTPEQRSSGLAELLASAADVTGPVPVFDASDARFLPPGDMPARIDAWCAEHGVAAPRDRAEYVRSILESLAAAYARAVDQAAALSGTTIDTIHIVGGGSQNELLCQLTADATGRTVLAGPVEATAIGNILVQGRALGRVHGSLESLRSLVARTFPPRRYSPRLEGRPLP
ncbi:rhamnulokinase [Labedella gwakjiensis]|uniref:Rhamnulokinase n=1 Tax=Labedella gwakjiensis TaxID=390269 RepID=A0A2P8GU13_9MICO|nr:rhamnulokinase family protein [Labedella gwakjiensis]PSL37451.1 rhamnulokinase [Labedella gwakjiensis]RUQ84762.1 rhamnulokinase [Labedella gwakjiensis]